MKLHEILAVEKGVKSRTYAEVTELHKAAQRAELFSGFTKTFTLLQEDQSGDVATQPPQAKRIQAAVADVLTAVAKAQAPYFDVVASKDVANTIASGNVKIDGETLLADVPVPFLLFLEKQLVDMATFVKALPVLDPSKAWTWSEEAGAWTTAPVFSLSTKKQPRPIILAPATVEHPAQVKMEYEDVPVGKWEVVHHSAAMRMVDKSAMIGRVTALLDAVKQARERANETTVPATSYGQRIMDFITKG